VNETAWPSVADVYRAQRRLAGVARRTPLERADWLSERADVEVHLKLECWQRTGSFKLRGAYNAVVARAAEWQGRGLVTASAGNHGQAVALAARDAGGRATVFVPAGSAEAKVSRIRALGAELRTVEGTYDDAQEAARCFARETGAVFVHAYADPLVVAGQGTVALELLEQLPDVRTVVVPVGGGGLIGGIGIVLRAADPAIRILGAQSRNSSAMHDAFAAGRVVPPPVGPTLADGLAGGVEPESFALVRRVAESIHVVEEDALPRAIGTLFRNTGIVAEGSGVAGIAALESGVLPPLDGPVVIVVTGGNIDAHVLASILAG